MNTLLYRDPAKFWEEALPLGNGRVGAMIFGGIDCERIELNEDTLWSGRPGDENGYAVREKIDEVRLLLREKRYAAATTLTDEMTGAHDSQCYQMAGNLYVECDAEGDVDGYRRSLDLNTAIATTHYKRNGLLFGRESFISAPHQVMVVRFTAEKPGSIRLRLSMDSQMQYRCHAAGNSVSLFGRCPRDNRARGAEKIVWEKDGETGIEYIVKLQAISDGGTLATSDQTLNVVGANPDVSQMIVL